MLDAIVFDFDGVIVDTEPLHYRAFLDVLGPLGVDFDYDRYVRQYIGFDDRDCFRVVCRQWSIPLDGHRLTELCEAKALAFKSRASEGVRTYPGAVGLIERAAAELPIALCSGALRSDIATVLSSIGDGRLAERFHMVVTAEDVTRSKPDPQSYELAVRRLGVSPGRGLAIEDTPAGLESARSAGLRTLGVAHSHRADQLAIAERVVGSLEGLSVGQLRQWYARPRSGSGA